MFFYPFAGMFMTFLIQTVPPLPVSPVPAAQLRPPMWWEKQAVTYQRKGEFGRVPGTIFPCPPHSQLPSSPSRLPAQGLHSTHISPCV